MKTHNNSRLNPTRRTSKSAEREMVHERAQLIKDMGRAVGLIFLLTIAAYWQSFSFDFIWDDDLHVTRNLITEPGGLARSWFTSHQPNYWPVTWSAFWLEWNLFALKPTGYHVVNVLLHALNASLLWLLLRRIAVPGALAVALLFAVHPVNVECVSWITQLKTLLSMALYLASLLCYVHWQSTVKRSYYLGALVLFTTGLLAKPSIVMLPVVLLIILIWQKRRLVWSELKPTVPFFCVAAVMSMTEIWFQTYRSGAGTIVRTDGFAARLASAGWVVWFYFGKVVWPTGLNFVYPRWRIEPGYLWSYVPGATLVFIVGVLAWLWRSCGRAALCALSYFVITLFPVMGFFNIFYMRYSFVADHWQYVAVPGVLILGVSLARWFLRLMSARYPGYGRRLELGLIVCALAVLSAVTFQHQKMYARMDTLYLRTLEKNPGAALAHSNLAGMFYRSGKLDDAVFHFRAALTTDANDPEAHAGLGNALFDMGRLEEASVEYQKALPLIPGPERFKVHFELANTYAKLGRNEDAARQFEEVLKLKPGLQEARKRMMQLQ